MFFSIFCRLGRHPEFFFFFLLGSFILHPPRYRNNLPNICVKWAKKNRTWKGYVSCFPDFKARTKPLIFSKNGSAPNRACPLQWSGAEQSVNARFHWKWIGSRRSTLLRCSGHARLRSSIVPYSAENTVPPWCYNNMLVQCQWGVWIDEIMKRHKPTGAEFEKKRRRETFKGKR